MLWVRFDLVKTLGSPGSQFGHETHAGRRQKRGTVAMFCTAHDHFFFVSISTTQQKDAWIPRPRSRVLYAKGKFTPLSALVERALLAL